MKQKEQQPEKPFSDTPNTTEETHNNNSSLTNNIPLENGMVIRKRDDKWFTTLGDTAITKPTDNYNGQLEQIDDLNYDVLIKIIIHVVKSMKLIDKMTENKTTDTDKNTL